MGDAPIFPPLPPMSGEPRTGSWYAESSGVRILTFHPRVPASGINYFPSRGLYLHDPATFSPIGGNMEAISVSGDSIYVIDCPLGWTGRLLLDRQREYEIAPGMVIPDRYARIELLYTEEDGIPSGVLPPYHFADSPIVLAVGPGAMFYRRPGWRIHSWKPETLGMVETTIGALALSPFTNPIFVSGYDSVCMDLSADTASNVIDTLTPRITGHIRATSGTIDPILQVAFNAADTYTLPAAARQMAPIFAWSNNSPISQDVAGGDAFGMFLGNYSAPGAGLRSLAQFPRGNFAHSFALRFRSVAGADYSAAAYAAVRID